MSFPGNTCRYVRRLKVNVPMLKTCCGCCSVKLGTAVLGTAETVLAAIHLLLLTVSYMSPDWDVLKEELSAYDVALEVTFACVDTIGLFVNILLLIGIGKDKAKFMFPAVIYYFVFVSFYCIILIIVFIAYVSTRRATVSGVEIIVFSILLFFPTKIFMYFWLVVYSCYRQMKYQIP